MRTPAAILDGADLVIVAVPTQATRNVVRSLGARIAPGLPVLGAAKGLEHGSRATIGEIFAEELPGTVPAVLSGPSFATDVARRLQEACP